MPQVRILFLQRAYRRLRGAREYLALPEVKALKSFKDRSQGVENRFIPYFGDRIITTIAKGDITEYRANRTLRKGKTPSVQTINYDHAMLKHLFSKAQEHGYITNHPAKEVKIPDPKNERDRILTDDEWTALYEASPQHLKPVLLTAYYTGMRVGEVKRLTWDRVDFKKDLIRLRKQDTKNGEARDVPMIPIVREHLWGLWKDRVLYTNRVFLYKGKPFLDTRKAFQVALDKANIKDFTMRDSRHCAVTNWRRAGVDLTTAMAIVGHKSEKMWKRYNTIEESDLSRAANKLNTLITLTSLSLQPQSSSST